MESIHQQKFMGLLSLQIFQGSARKLVLAACKKIKVGHLVIQEGSKRYSFGEPKAAASVCAHITVHEEAAYSAFIANGTIGSAEAYIRRDWTSPDLLAVIRLMVLNIRWLSQINQKRSWAHKVVLLAYQWCRVNSRQGSKKNISAHYDLGNDFFELFLDKQMMYSSAIYQSPEQSLDAAAENKLDVICQKLELSKDDHLLEIGSGWGGMAIHAAKHYGCQVTTTTISKEQYAYARERVKAEGLEHQVEVLLEDYRDLNGEYDKLVSIEMIEAVGYQYYRHYFDKCNSLLKDDGLMLIQSITIPDDRYESARKSTDFIKKMIFPGGCLPSNEILTQHVSRDTNMQIIDLHDITEHYAATLAQWYKRFDNKLHDVHAQGYSDAFCRLWEFYLKYCEGGFRERVIGTVQVLLAKPGYRKSLAAPLA